MKQVFNNPALVPSFKDGPLLSMELPPGGFGAGLPIKLSDYKASWFYD